MNLAPNHPLLKRLAAIDAVPSFRHQGVSYIEDENEPDKAIRNTSKPAGVWCDLRSVEEIGRAKRFNDMIPDRPPPGEERPAKMEVVPFVSYFSPIQGNELAAFEGAIATAEQMGPRLRPEQATALAEAQTEIERVKAELKTAKARLKEMGLEGGTDAAAEGDESGGAGTAPAVVAPARRPVPATRGKAKVGVLDGEDAS